MLLEYCKAQKWLLSPTVNPELSGGQKTSRVTPFPLGLSLNDVLGPRAPLAAAPKASDCSLAAGSRVSHSHGGPENFLIFWRALLRQRRGEATTERRPSDYAKALRRDGEPCSRRNIENVGGRE